MSAPETRKREPGPITRFLLGYHPTGSGPLAWGAISGPEAASSILLKAYGMTQCLYAGLDEKDSEFNALADTYKALAVDGIGDLIILAKVLCDEN